VEGLKKKKKLIFSEKTLSESIKRKYEST